MEYFTLKSKIYTSNYGKNIIFYYFAIIILALLFVLGLSGCTLDEFVPDNSQKDERSKEDNTKDKDSTDKKSKKKKNSKSKRKFDKVDYTNGTNVTWFEEQGLEYTKFGEFKAKFSGYYDYDDIREMPADCYMYESFDDCEEGYKNIIAVINIYTEDSGDVQWWTSYFDAYTGTSFEFHSEQTSTYNGCDIINSGTAKLDIVGNEFDFHITHEVQEEQFVITETITLTVPASYDGLVIQLGQSSELYDENRNNYNIGYEYYYADDFTNMHEQYDYFSLLSNKK